MACDQVLDEHTRACDRLLGTLPLPYERRQSADQVRGELVEEIRLEDRLHGRSEVVHARAGEFVGFVEGSL